MNEEKWTICIKFVSITKPFVLSTVILECYKYLMKWLWCNIPWSHSHKSYIIAYFERRNAYATGVDCINSYSHFSSFHLPYYFDTDQGFIFKLSYSLGIKHYLLIERILIKLCKITKIIKCLCKLENFRLYCWLQIYKFWPPLMMFKRLITHLINHQSSRISSMQWEEGHETKMGKLLHTFSVCMWLHQFKLTSR